MEIHIHGLLLHNDMFPGSTYRRNLDEHGVDDKYFTNKIMMQKME